MSSMAEEFWRTRVEYPPVHCNSRRRYLDLGVILNHVGEVKSLLDLGCGEGQNLLMLRELTDIVYYCGFDLCENFIHGLRKRWGEHPGLIVRTLDFVDTPGFPKVDLCLCMGVLLYVFDDDELRNMFARLKTKKLICRMPCTLTTKRLVVSEFSEEYGAVYSAVYRTVAEYISILSESFVIKSVDRCYPDEIESRYGSKQFVFICEG